MSLILLKVTKLWRILETQGDELTLPIKMEPAGPGGRRLRVRGAARAARFRGVKTIGTDLLRRIS
jgi:hypothetical protein